jgi:hypothetical protein
MHILFDHNAPRGIARHLVGHSVTEAKERGWERLTNGALLSAAEEAGFDLLLTADKNMRLSAEPFRPENRSCGSWQFSLAACPVAPR